MKFKEMNLPNKLTNIRMWCVPIVILLFALYAMHNIFALPTDYVFDFKVSIVQILIFVVFVSASITDFLDGNIARKNNLVSDYGKIMDPLADKLLVNITLICLASFNFLSYNKVIMLISSLIILVIIARDMFVDALRMQALKKGVVSPAKVWGKLKTATLMPGIAITILGSINPVLYYIGTILIILGGVFALIGGINYAKEMMPYFDEK